MELIDRDELREALNLLVDERHNIPVWNDAIRISLEALNAMPSVEQPVGMTRDDVLAALDAAEARGDKAVVEYLDTSIGKWYGTYLDNWINPEVPRLNVRVRVTEQAPEKVPLTQLVGRTIHGETEPVTSPPAWTAINGKAEWRWLSIPHGKWLPFPEGTLNLETGQVAVRPKGEA